MVLDNIQTASSANVGDLTASDEAMLSDIVKSINSTVKVGCTGCGYCTPCPKGVDIPGTFAAYNRLYTDGKFTALKEYIMCTALRKTSTAASNCINCGKCESHCPQHIEIRAKLKDAQKELEGPIYKIARKLSSIFVKF